MPCSTSAALGGIDFDDAVFAHVSSMAQSGFDALDPEDSTAVTAVARLREECVEAKECLSSDTDVSVPVILPSMSTEVRLTRAEFEGMIRPRIEDAIGAMRRSLASAKVEPKDVGAILLVTDQKAIGYPVLAHQSVTFSLKKSSIHKGHKTTGKGKGTAASHGRKVELQVEKSGRWYDVKSTHEFGSGSFKFSIKGSKAGKFHYRAVASDHAGYVQFGYPPARTLTVKK